MYKKELILSEEYYPSTMALTDAHGRETKLDSARKDLGCCWNVL
jgi:hypothetical protein